MTYEVEGQMNIFDLDSSFGKTCQAHSLQEAPKAKTSASSSKKSQGSATRMPLFLDLRSGGGADASWQMGGALLGVYTMLSFGEQPNTLMEECGFEALPNGVGVSRLSQILVDTPLPKYYLSARACSGILNRAEKRGKALPPELKAALENQAKAPQNDPQDGGSECTEPFRKELDAESEGGCEVDSHGKKAGKGALVQTELSGTVSAVQDQTLIRSAFPIEGNGQRESHRGGGFGNDDEPSFTLNSVERHGVSVTYGRDPQSDCD